MRWIFVKKRKKEGGEEKMNIEEEIKRIREHRLLHRKLLDQKRNQQTLKEASVTVQVFATTDRELLKIIENTLKVVEKDIKQLQDQHDAQELPADYEYNSPAAKLMEQRYEACRQKQEELAHHRNVLRDTYIVLARLGVDIWVDMSVMRFDEVKKIIAREEEEVNAELEKWRV